MRCTTVLIIVLDNAGTPLRFALDVIESVKWLQLRALVHCHPALEEVRERLGDVVFSMLARRHGENIVELLECALLGLGYEEEDHDEGRHVQEGVETESARRGHCSHHAGPGERQDRRPKETSGDSPSHS